MPKISGTEDTKKVIRWLDDNPSYVNRYLDSCKLRGVLPSCSDFFSVTSLDWHRVYNLRYSLITGYLREKYRRG